MFLRWLLVSRIANKLRMSESIDVRNPSGIMDLAGHTYSRNFCYTTLEDLVDSWENVRVMSSVILGTISDIITVMHINGQS